MNFAKQMVKKYRYHIKVLNQQIRKVANDLEEDSRQLSRLAVVAVVAAAAAAAAAVVDQHHQQLIGYFEEWNS